MKFLSIMVVCIGVLMFSEANIACCVCMLCSVDTQIRKQVVTEEKICQDQAGKLSQEAIQQQ